MSRRIIILVALVAGLVVAIVLISHNGPGDTAQGRPLTVQLQWEPSAQFLGFYSAKEQGFYSDAALDVKFLHGGPNVDPISNIINGNAEIGLATADQVLRWNDHHATQRLKAVGTVFDGSLAVFMVRADSGINGPRDFKGKRIGVFPSYDTESLMLLMLRKVGLSRNDVDQINFPNFANFETGEIDVFGSYIINEPELAALRDIHVRLIDPVTSGIHFYSDTVITREDYLKLNRGLVADFLRASSRGWKFAEGNLDDALKDMRGQVGGVFGAGEPWQHQERAAAAAVKYLRGGTGNLLSMRQKTWKLLASDLRSIGVISREGIVDETCVFDVLDGVEQTSGR
jgi:ABC-type nitrate/sulfonate/bicarbonate transport system substrate-binding protein